MGYMYLFKTGRHYVLRDTVGVESIRWLTHKFGYVIKPLKKVDHDTYLISNERGETMKMHTVYYMSYKLVRI